ncbi:MAG: CDP-diacylglycerol--glycerol-3-phosphate 3-phosphatidyltransferase [Oscillospiraceae bacterium]|nr:CDP-diacylglycerol--glycerol-3-phosphate 3-phosphatidyltransferase [Oscillospiraceae bacterium]
MNLPNKLTRLRFVLVPVFMVFMYTPGAYSYLIALIVFAVASFTDFLDGSIARKYNMVTDFGKFMDPLADKLLTTVALIYLCLNGMCHEVVICIVLAREFAVSGIRLIAAANPKGGKVIAAGMMGKMKTVFQMVASMLGLLAMALVPLGLIADSTYMLMANITNILMWIMAVLTVVSGMQYILPNIDLIKNAK